jgi:hypothetical protein
MYKKYLKPISFIVFIIGIVFACANFYSVMVFNKEIYPNAITIIVLIGISAAIIRYFSER